MHPYRAHLISTVSVILFSIEQSFVRSKGLLFWDYNQIFFIVAKAKFVVEVYLKMKSYPEYNSSEVSILILLYIFIIYF